ncbi:hypothetical protein T492DRAFT_968101, partial [Pavlovales sp. CCMP2436]
TTTIFFTIIIIIIIAGRTFSHVEPGCLARLPTPMVEELDIDLPSAIGDIYLTTALTAASRIDISNGIGVANISAHRGFRLMESFSLAEQTWCGQRSIMSSSTSTSGYASSS